MSLKKHIWKGLAVAAAFVLSTGLVTQSAFAAATVTQQATGNIWLGTTAAGPGASGVTSQGLTNLIVTETGAGTLTGTFTMLAPTGWNFVSAGGASATGGMVASTALTNATTITVTIGTPSTTSGVLTVSGVTVKAISTSASAGDILAGGANAQVPANTVLGHIEPQATLILITAGPDATVSSDGTDSATLTFKVFNPADASLGGISVNVTTSRGTLSATSSTTPSSACSTSGTSNTNSSGCTLTFRGNGTTGTAQITATTGAPNEAVATLNATVGSSNQSPTAIKTFSTNNSGHIASSIQNVYTTPTLGARVRFQVTGGSGDGVNGELIQATVDKGYIVQGDSSGSPTAGNLPGSCAGSNTTASDTSHGPVTIDGTDYSGIVEFTVCAKAGQTGAIKVTAKNLSTTMADASTSLVAAGVPNKIETTVTGGSVTAKVTDKDGNEVADGTTITFNVPAFTGTAAPSCTTTTGGKAAASAAFSGAGGQVLVTVFISDTGSGNASTCATLGSSAAASVTVNVGAGGSGGGTTTGGGFTGTAPGKGSIGLLVTNQASGAAGLVSALGTAGCTVESLAVLESGTWKIYINGAPAVVNSAFPGTVAATTAFFVRCAA